MDDSIIKKNCIFLFHLSTGDNFTMYAAVMNYQKIYENVYIYCLYRNILFITQLYEKYKNVHIIMLNDPNYNNCLVPENDKNDLINKIQDYDLIECGYHNNESFSYFNNNKHFYFWKSFYMQIELPYEIRYDDDYKDINRNLEKEQILYKNLIEKYGEKYIFVHDHRNVKYQHGGARKNVDLDINKDIPIFHPNFNYYNDYPEHKYYHLWNEQLFLSDNLLDYGMIIENATEIHINDSSFSCFCPYLDLSQVKNKSIITNLDVIDYHNSFEDWTVING
jgi:hypothetical protein